MGLESLMNKIRRITRGIKNCRVGRLFKGCSPCLRRGFGRQAHQPACTLIGNRPQPATFHTAKRETPSEAVWQGMGYSISILEITSNPSIGVNPICTKSVDRAVANHMGESVRIAVKFMASEYAGCAIEPRNGY